MRHVGRVGRPVGGSGALTDGARSPRSSALGGQRAHRRRGRRRSAATAAASSASRWPTAPRSTAPIVVSACDPRRTFVEWLRHPAGRRGGDDRPVAAPRRTPRATSRRSTPSSTAEPVLRDATHRLSSTLTDRADGRRDGPRRRRCCRPAAVLERPALLVNVPSIADPTMAPRRPPRVQPRGAAHAVPPPGGWAGSPEPQRWLELFAARCEPGFLDSIVDWRAMTPDVYEREFHLPAGHAASFAGGPLAALRSRRPRADPLRDGRARAVPHRRGDVPRRRRLGRQRPQLRHRGARRPSLIRRGQFSTDSGRRLQAP